MLDMREAAREHALTFDQAALTDSDREMAVVTWRGRMVNEHVSARVFAGLVPQMMAAGVDVRLQLEVASMIQEELRHGVLCAAAVEALGGEARAPLPRLEAVPQHDDCEPLEGLLRNILSVCCLSETVAVALITAERLETRPAELQAALTEILADEVGHARFGWRLLDELAPRIGQALRQRLGDYLPVAFLHLLHYELAHLPVQATPPSDIVEGYGVCNGRDARALFYDTIATVIVPELEARGLPGEAAWSVARAEYEAPLGGLH
jgi:hypothetical protein